MSRFSDRPPEMLLRTKLHLPQLGAGLVSRGRLQDSLGSADKLPLIVISAPAGYGKSVLAAQWAEGSGLPVAWVSLDQSDSELRAFLSYLVAAVDGLFPERCRGLRELLASPATPPISSIATTLLHDLEALETRCVLVLDDYHRLKTSSQVHELLNHLLAHPLPSFHLILVTRRDPPLALSRLRANHLIHELRLQDLRFTDGETQEFLNAVMKLAVSEEALANLQVEVEGWAVGLRLVSLALRHVSDPDAFLREMRGGLPNVREYLMQEVLAKLPPQVRELLLVSSLLERFCLGLLEATCEAYVTAPDFQGQDFLDELERLNLFLIPLDAIGQWYRYHHLFQELLQNELRREYDDEQRAKLHLRASEWFEAEGLVQEALQHALNASDMARAIGLVERHRHHAIDADHWYELESWLSLFPDSVIQEQAELLMARVWLYVHFFRFEATWPLLDHIEKLLGDTSADTPLHGETALFRGYILFFMGDAAAGLEFTTQALQKIPVTRNEARAQSEVIFALCSQMVGNRERAQDGLDKLLVAYDSPTELRKTRLLVTQVFIHYLCGETDAAEQVNDRLRATCERGGYAYAHAWMHYLQGLIHLQRLELEEALDHLDGSVQQRAIHFTRAGADSIIGLLLSMHFLGRDEDVASTRELLKEYAESLEDPSLWALVGSTEARLAILQGRSQDAIEWLRSAFFPPEGALIWWLESPAITRCRVQLATGEPDELEEALAALRALCATVEAQHNDIQLIGILVLIAVAHEKMGQLEESRSALCRALELAEPGGVLLPFLEAGPPLESMLTRALRDQPTSAFATQVLALLERFRGSSSRAPAATTAAAVDPSGALSLGLDPLTNRELDVLELLVDRLQDKEIADRLNISSHTVRDHLKHIYDKLDVHGRREAVRRASKLGILRGDSQN